MAKSKETPRYEDFAYQGDEPTLTAEEILARRQEFWVPTGYSSDTGEQELLVTRTMPSPGRHFYDTPIVRGTAFSDEASRPENGIFDYVVAEGTGRTVYSVHAPGVHFEPWRRDNETDAYDLTPDQREELAKGSFRKVGDATLLAAQRVIELVEPDNKDAGVIISASSQGAAMMAGAIPAAVERGSEIRAIVASEIVNNDEWELTNLHSRPPFIGGLAEEFIKANGDAKGYLDQNPKVLRDATENRLRWVRRVSNNLGNNLVYARALPKGKFNEDLDDATLERLARDEQATQVILTRGGESLLARKGAHENVRVRMGRKGLNVASIIYPSHTHPYTMNVRSIIDPVNSLQDIA